MQLFLLCAIVVGIFSSEAYGAIDRPDCDKDADPGVCDAYMPRYYYNNEYGMCMKFIYGGCGGNRNNFATEEDCYNKCGALLTENVCEQDKVVGPCRAAFRRFYFNKETGQCEKFTYGGCSGNGNNFASKEQCESTCLAHKAIDRPDCDKAPDSGLCDAYMPRFYYDKDYGMCKKFIYGGCGGNRNNFASEEECYNKCGALSSDSVCEQEKVVGPCRAAFRRFYFNKETGQCEKFIYGGCSGNDNNFVSKEQCESTCLA